MASKGIKKGTQVKWKFTNYEPEGFAKEIATKPGEKVGTLSQAGNKIIRKADEGNPAVRIERRGKGNNNEVVKKMSELTKVGEGDEFEDESEESKEPTVGEKRGCDEVAGETERESKTARGKTNIQGNSKASNSTKRGRGRGRGKAATNGNGRKRSTRAENGSTDVAQEQDLNGSTTEDATTDADAPGEPDSGGSSDAGH